MDPQQELFTKLKLEIEALGYSVYDCGLPPEGTPYPFTYLGDSQSVDEALKNATFGTVHQTIHVWHNDSKKRGTVSAMLLDIKGVCRRIERTDHYGWTLTSASQQILPDTTTETPLLHGVLEVSFKFH